MCLTSRYKDPFIAKKDIECYKQIQVTKVNDQIIFFTPYQHKDVTNEVRNTKILVPEFWSIVKERLNYFFKFRKRKEYYIRGGYIHSYMPHTLGDIDRMRLYGYNSDCIFLKCIIPAGSLYYKDEFCGEYASDKIIITESDENINHFLDNIYPPKTYNQIKQQFIKK